MIKVGIIGASGYVGAELVRLLFTHKEAEIVALGSTNHQGKKMESLYPNLTSLLMQPIVANEEVIDKSDIVFLALPHGLSQDYAKQCIEKGKKVIDLGADFRLKSEAEYEAWYGGNFIDQKLHDKAVYGLSEIFTKEIKKASLIANPGCYPTSASLSLIPLLQYTDIVKDSIIIDAKSGVTGAGKALTKQTHFPYTNENFNPYAIGTHRHTPEIEQMVNTFSNQNNKITFTPHLLPVNRGILSTIYVKLNKKIEIQKLHQFMKTFYAEKLFVRILPLGQTANLKGVTHSNYCDISIHENKRSGQIILVSAIDNMIKGAAGQAIQNMNIMYELPEIMGLSMAPTAF